jgi:threonine dehydrogenase-like Zn-dependent dehydrogenase
MSASTAQPARVRAAVKVGKERTEIREFPWPTLGPADGVLRVEASGVGGAEPEVYRSDRWQQIIMGHQIVGSIAAVGELARTLWRVEPGERVVLQEYLPCKSCAWCLQGEYRFCPAADFFGDRPNRIGLLSSESPPHLVGGFAEYVYLPWNTVIHRIPQDLPAALATLAIPLGNGVQWATLDVNAGPGKTVLVIGPGQQGLGCVIAARDAGASRVILAGLSRDLPRLELSLELGADHFINAETDDLLARVQALTGGGGLDVVIDTTSDPGGKNLEQYLQVVNQGAWLWVNCVDGAVPVREIKKKYLTVRSGRGRTWQAVERALRIIRSRRFPLEKLATHTFGLAEVDRAIKATGGREVAGAVHVIVDPWR